MTSSQSATAQTEVALGPMRQQAQSIAPLPAGSSSPSPSPKPASSGTSLTPFSPPKTIANYLAQHPKSSPGQAISTLFPKKNPISRLIHRFQVKHSVINGLTKAELEKWERKVGPQARRRAGWKLAGEEGDGVVVSEIFWKMYTSLLPTLQRDPLSGLVPPDLLGSTTTMPLSIISLIPDIMTHYRDCIVRAEKEVFLATNYWQPSNSVNTISGALKELSIRTLAKGPNQPRVVVKIMYDRGSWEQLWNAHAFVKPVDWGPLDLPEKHDVPGLDMQVINFHRVLLGTFHAKFLIVDRKVALINSNNIQDRPNLELMTHLEGPVVDAFYETALHSWHNRLTPSLPCMTTPYAPPLNPETSQPSYKFSHKNPYFDDIEVLKAAKAARLRVRQQAKEFEEEDGAAQQSGDRLVDVVKRAMAERGIGQSLSNWAPGEELEMMAENAKKEFREFRERWGIGSRAGSRRQSLQEIRDAYDHNPEPTHMSGIREPSEAYTSSPTLNGDQATMISPSPQKAKTYPLPDSQSKEWDKVRDAFVTNDNTHKVIPSHEAHPAPQIPEDATYNGDAAFFVLGDAAVAASPASTHSELPQSQARTEPSTEPIQRNDRVQGSTTQAAPLPAKMPSEAEAIKAAAIAESVDGGEPVGVNVGSKRMFQLSKRFNAGALSDAWATVEDSDDLDTFRPHVVHAPHDPFPIAMCSRKPHGFPGHHDIRNPQNAAWLAGFRYAQKKVFIQTPTLNARPIVRAIKQTCRRGVEVVLLLDLGFNDKGESIPFQGGTNEQVVDRLYKKLTAEKKEQFLKVYWYTGKDQVRPLNAIKKQRNCHIKFAAFDDEVLIVGNGNQDSQSWFHSQEVNVMLDSKQIVAEMMDTLLSNQNTVRYGLVSTDGIWRDSEGKTLQDYDNTKKGRYQGLAGFLMFIKTI